MDMNVMNFSRGALGAHIKEVGSQSDVDCVYGHRGLVLQDTLINKVIVLSGALKPDFFYSEGPASIRVLKGTVMIKIFQIVLKEYHDVTPVFGVKDQVKQVTLAQNTTQSFSASSALNIESSPDAVFLVNVGKSSEHAFRAQICANTHVILSAELKYQRHTNLLCFTAFLKRASCASSLHALYQLSRASLLPIAWSALEALSQRSPSKAMKLLKMYQLYHCNADVSLKAIDWLCNTSKVSKNLTERSAEVI
ncbi:hypothetical protein PALB_35000 [Pseudoalteromonas luteoviolacea B = ATCC 29581]|nr:hypothetical protein PALB_35000 [Pseudoalteromonas luteoviolacea B = ATCC 29581]